MPHSHISAADKAQRSHGRYGLQGAHQPVNGFGRPSSRTMPTTIVAVPDPFAKQERILATVNRQVDVLEMERSHGRLSEAGYIEGRLVQAMFERLSSRGMGSQWADGGRGDAWVAKELKIIRGADSAHKITAYMEEMTRIVGIFDARLLRRVLGDGLTFAEVAALQGKGGDRGQRYIANRFRDAIEHLAEGRAAVGPDRGRHERVPAVPAGE